MRKTIQPLYVLIFFVSLWFWTFEVLGIEPRSLCTFWHASFLWTLPLECLVFVKDIRVWENMAYTLQSTIFRKFCAWWGELDKWHHSVFQSISCISSLESLCDGGRNTVEFVLWAAVITEFLYLTCHGQPHKVVNPNDLLPLRGNMKRVGIMVIHVRFLYHVIVNFVILCIYSDEDWLSSHMIYLSFTTEPQSHLVVVQIPFLSHGGC